MDDFDEVVQEFEKQYELKQNAETVETVEQVEQGNQLVAQQDSSLMEQQTSMPMGGFQNVVGGVKQNILNKAKEKIADEKSVDRHAENLKNIANKALDVEAEYASLQVQEQEADNKVHKQEIKNRLIVLKAEAVRLAKEQKQLNKEQKADHKRRNMEAKWELYKDKLTKMKYTYVPNAFVLAMLLFFDGVRSFFDGLGTVSTAIVKALKWFILIGIILIVLFSIPVTREWITNILTGVS